MGERTGPIGDPDFASEPAWLKLGQTIPTAPSPIWAQTTAGLGEGFVRVGGVAILPGDAATVSSDGTGLGITRENLMEISRRFIRSYGDDYDQIAIFLGFTDRKSPMALAYQMPIKNDVRGIGIGIFDSSSDFGSGSGRMQTMLNMKRINVYGIEAATDPNDSLYPVWAQETAHRWLAYLKFRRTGDAANRDDLIGRDAAHWGRWVHTEASVMDGVNWQTNPDGTFTPTERNKRFGLLDQYAMGLREASEVPPFFFLDNFIDENGQAIEREMISISARRKYKANRTDVTMQDVLRAMGPRSPASGGAASDLRMGVVFITPPGVAPAEIVGEAFLVDQTRAPWDGFYNTAGQGRGKVCTELLRPCRGPAFEYSNAKLTKPAGVSATVSPGDAAVYSVDVTNRGTEQGIADVSLRALFGLQFDGTRNKTPPLAPGATTTLSWTAMVPADAPCFAPIRVEHESVAPLGPSRGNTTVTVGMIPSRVYDFESNDSSAGWTVNPDGMDTATAGAWELGRPEKTVATILPGFVIQPGAAFSGINAFATGLAAGENEAANDLDFDRGKLTVGRTTLQSPFFELAGLRNPRLSYHVRFVAVDFDKRVLVPAKMDAMRVFVSPDGTNWTEVDRLTGIALDWEQRIVDLPKLFGTTLPARLQFRFIAEDDPFSDNVVEAVIDDVVLHAESPSCTTTTAPVIVPPDDPPIVVKPEGSDDSGCGCHVGRRQSKPASALWIVLLFGVMAWRRHRLCRPTHP
ncbi:MAG: MYXO-CTERM sorting domain-containing protein [Deltaproteobacteria bacterium]|nr:MYXO-CTERM sorting domain-containing protein [Deltaproteobacteria bacterium]